MNRHHYTILFIVWSLIVNGGVVAAAQEKPPLQFGLDSSIFMGLSPAETKVTMIQIMKMAGIGSKEMETTQFESAEAMERAIRNEEIEFFTMRSCDYIRLRDELNIVPVSVPIVSDGVIGNTLVLLSNKPDLALQDVVNRTIFLDPSRTHGLERMWLETVLMENGIGTIETVFSEVMEVERPNQAVLSTFFGNADFCLVLKHVWEDLAELNPQLSARLYVVEQSKPLIPVMLAIRKTPGGIDGKLLAEELAKIHSTKEGQMILTLAKTQQIAPFDARRMEATEDLILRYENVKKGEREAQTR